MPATINILAVDDEVVILDLLRRILSKDPTFKVTTATKGYQAVQMAAREKFDVIICDIVMPDISGTELIQEMRAKKICPPQIIFMSGAVKSVANMAANTMFIRKPFNPAEIITAVTRMARK